MRKRIDPGVAVGAFLALAAAAIMSSLPRNGLLAHTAADDALYYLAIARRAGEVGWPTFDGVHTTTGFHPLWLFVLVPIAKMVGAPWALLRIAVALSSVLMVAASVSFGRLFARAWGAEAGVIGGVLLIASPGSARLGWMAMEAPLALLVLSFSLSELFRDRARAGRLGLLMGLTVLARLDMAIVLAVGLLWMVLVRRKIPVRSAIVAGAVASLTLAPYIAWNVALTGHAATISSATKAYVAADVAQQAHGGRINAGFAEDAFHEIIRSGKEIARLSPASLFAGPVALAAGDHPSAANPAHHRAAIFFLTAVALVVGGLTAFRRRRCTWKASSTSADLLVVLAIASAVHSATACILLTRQSGPWYWGLEVVTIVAAVSHAASRSRSAHWVGAVLSGAMLASMAMLVAGLLEGRITGRFDDRASFASVMLQAGAALDAQRAPDDIVGSCNAGTLGFFDPSVVNLDGLVNDWALLDARRQHAMRAYLTRENVRWIVDCVPATAMDRYARQLDLTPSEIETKAEIIGPTCVGFVWRISEPPPIASRH